MLTSIRALVKVIQAVTIHTLARPTRKTITEVSRNFYEIDIISCHIHCTYTMSKKPHVYIIWYFVLYLLALRWLPRQQFLWDHRPSLEGGWKDRGMGIEYSSRSHTESIECNKVPVLLGEGELLIQLKINCMIRPHLNKKTEGKRFKITTIGFVFVSVCVCSSKGYFLVLTLTYWFSCMFRPLTRS